MTGPCLCGDPACGRCFPRPGPGRETFCLRLPPELLAQVRVAAWSEKKSANALLSEIVSGAMNKKGGKK